MDTLRKLEEAMNSDDRLFCELQDKLNYVCKAFDLDPDKYMFYIGVMANEETEDED